MMMADGNSVYSCITQLCEKIESKISPPRLLENRNSCLIIKRLRTLAFEILLNKSQKRINHFSSEDDMDAISKIVAYSYTLHQHQLTNQARKLSDLINNIANSDMINNPNIEAVLLFLANMAGEIPDNFRESNGMLFYRESTNTQISKILSTRKVKPYEEFDPKIFELSLTLELDRKSAYIPDGIDFPFDEEPGTDLALLGKFGGFKQNRKHYVDFFTFPDLVKPRGLVIPKDTNFAELLDEGYESPSRDSAMTASCLINNFLEMDDNSMWDLILNADIPYKKTWETFNTFHSPKEMYLTDCAICSVEKLWKAKMGIRSMYLNSSKAGHPLLRTLSYRQLLHDLKSLLIGLPSQTFQYNEEGNGFIMESNIYVEGISPGTLNSFCKDFLVTGICYLRLNKLVSCDIRGKCLQDGLIFQAFCRTLRQYLQQYRATVSCICSEDVLLHFRQKCDILHVQMSCLGYLCKVHPNMEEETLPEGIALLAYLYQEICRVTRKDITCILYSIVKACCQVYFSFLQKWIFEGSCQDTHTEFFIQEQPTYITYRQREYWTVAHFMMDEAIPDFLRGFEKAVYQCGKAINLLKLCSPQDPLCVVLQSDYPAVRCCLSSSDLDVLEKGCLRYQSRVLTECGEPFSINSLFRTDLDEEKAFQLAIQTARQEHFHRLKMIREAEIQKIEARKHAELAILKEQIEHFEAQKEEERKQQLKEDEQFAKEALMKEKEMNKMIELEKANLVEYYSTLTELAEKRSQHAEWRMERLKLQEKRLKLENINDISISDITNPNNNEIPQDINSNQPESHETDDNTNDKISECAKVDNQNYDILADNIEDKKNNSETFIKEINKNLKSSEVVYSSKTENKTLDSISVEIERKLSKQDRISSNLPKENFQDNKLCKGDVILDTKITENKRNRNITEEAERNYKKIMHSEFNILTGEPWNAEKNKTKSDVEIMLEPKCVQSASSLDDNTNIESNTTYESANSWSYQSISESSSQLFEQAQNKLADKYINYTLLSTLTDKPLVNITDGILDTENKSSSVPSDIISINVAIQKSILIPLKVQASLVNSALLKLFFENNELLLHLCSLRNYFFLLDGEFGRNVTSALFERMYQVRRPVDLLNCMTLNSILSRAVTQADSNADRLSFNVKYIPSHFSFSSPLLLDCIMLQYKVTWPLNIIITGTALQKYDDVFGFLLRLHRISWILKEDFHHLKRVANDKPKVLCSPQYHQIQLYRHEMTHFVHALQNYVTATVLQSSWVKFVHNLQNARTLDDVYRTHVAYIKTVLFGCLLNKQSASIQKILLDTLRMILKFHGQLRSQTWHQSTDTAHYQHPKFNTLIQIYESFHKLALYTFMFATKLANTGYQPHLLEFLQIVNMNGFYSEKC